MRINHAIVLAAGKSTRYGTNKLTKVIDGKTLPEYIMDFCIMNGIDNVYITINKDDVYIQNNTDIRHRVVGHNQFYEHMLNIHYSFQNENEYGTGAAIKAWEDVINEPFIVLAGDNFYYGKLPEFDFERYECYATYKNLAPNARNLQLAAIRNNIIIEKPHQFTEGNFFCGYCAFAPSALKKIAKIEKSGRGEYEMTDLINYCDDRHFIENDMIWGDVTFAGDEDKIVELIEETNRKIQNNEPLWTQEPSRR